MRQPTGLLGDNLHFCDLYEAVVLFSGNREACRSSVAKGSKYEFLG